MWDKRWVISVPKDYYPEGSYVKALGNPTHRTVDNLSPRLRHDVPQGRIRATLPAIWCNHILIGIPSIVPVDKDEAIARLDKVWPPEQI